jgi:hypothetical protein
MFQQRTSEQIRIDALKMGLKKAQEGCLACAYGYFTLAKQHGASDEEIQEAIDKANKADNHTLQRRDVLKMIVSGGLAAAAGSLAVGTAEYSTGQAKAASLLWGTDSSSQACCAMPQNFYIGRMGYGVEPVGDAYFFNINSASVANASRTYGYWGLVGPGFSGSWSPYDYGRKQADCAWNAWNHGPNAPHISGLTIFADVEPGFGGWTFGNYAANQAVINGFLRELRNIMPHRRAPGLYISPYYWSNLVGIGFRPATAFVLWVTGCDTCGGDLCSPCNSACNTLTTVKNRLAATVSQTSLGGYKPVIWQYWISSYGCGDYDVMTQNATSLSPSRSRMLYNAG